MVTGLRRLRPKLAAAWLGMLAMGLNALVPVHLAFDLADALEAPHERHAGAAHQDHVRSFLGALSAHRDHGGASGGHEDRHHHPDCQVCGALGALGVFAAPLLAFLLAPPAREALASPAGVDIALPAAAPAAYFVRGPPLA